MIRPMGRFIWYCEGNGDLAYTDPLIGDGIAVYQGGLAARRLGLSWWFGKRDGDEPLVARCRQESASGLLRRDYWGESVPDL